MSQASLLTIPQELRERIVELVLTSDVADAPDLSKLELITQHRSELPKDKGTKVVRAWTGVRDLLFEPFKPLLHPIFLVNRQLSSDAALVLARIKVDYHLDVILLNEVSLLPTWIMIPKLASRVETLTCTFRIAGSAELGTGYRGYRGFRGGDGAGPAMAWVIYCLLELFILHGPSFGYGRDISSSSDQGYSIRTLVINVETPPGIDPSRFGPPLTSHSFGRRRREGETQPNVVDPKYLVKFIQTEIQGLLCMGYHTAEYGDILHENIGSIVIKLDGETHFNQDLWEVLKDLSPTYDGATFSKHQRVKGFQDWKPRAIAKRSRRGLNIGGAEVDADLEHKSYKQCYLIAERLEMETRRQ
jgi:hypothetical protein